MFLYYYISRSEGLLIKIVSIDNIDGVSESLLIFYETYCILILYRPVFSCHELSFLCHEYLLISDPFHPV